MISMCLYLHGNTFTHTSQLMTTTTHLQLFTPPLASGLPFVGSVLSLMNDSQEFFYSQYRKLGNVFRVRAFKNEFKVLAGPEINILLATEADAFTAYDTWAPVVQDFGGKRTLTMIDGPEHARMRKLMRQSFSREAVENNIPAVVGVISENLRGLPMNQHIDAAPFVQRLTANVLGLLSNGRMPAEHFEDIVFWWNSLVEVHIAHLKPVKTLESEAYQRARSRVKQFAQSVYDERMAMSAESKAGEDNFIDNLAAASMQDPDFLSHDEALFLLLAAYFAGLDTVANVSSFMLYELLRHADILAAARSEADVLFANGMPTAAGIRKMPVLHAVALETLRLYPIAGVLPRNAARDFKVGNYTIKKGEFFMVANAAPHFSPEFYADPYSFDITRYSEPRNEHKKRGVFAPFGAGPHTCLGAGMAEIQIMLSIATMLHQLDFAMDPAGYKLKKVYAPSMTPKGFGFRIAGKRTT